MPRRGDKELGSPRSFRIPKQHTERFSKVIWVPTGTDRDLLGFSKGKNFWIRVTDN